LYRAKIVAATHPTLTSISFPLTGAIAVNQPWKGWRFYALLLSNCFGSKAWTSGVAMKSASVDLADIYLEVEGKLAKLSFCQQS
jgi:hypothetical protein